MITILTADYYRGFSAHLGEVLAGANAAAQPIFVDRVVWPGCDEAEDVVIKLYETSSCGVANEVIGYVANALRGVHQPRKSGVLLLSKQELPDLKKDLNTYIDPHTGFAAAGLRLLKQAPALVDIFADFLVFRKNKVRRSTAASSAFDWPPLIMLQATMIDTRETSYTKMT